MYVRIAENGLFMKRRPEGGAGTAALRSPALQTAVLAERDIIATSAAGTRFSTESVVPAVQRSASLKERSVLQ